MRRKILSIVVPCYNEEDTIEELICRLNKLDLSNYNIRKEIVIVNDGSTDNTSEKVKKFDVKLVEHSRNIGKGMAIRTGIVNSSGDIIVIQDGDLEYPPENIPKLLEEFVKGRDVVYGSRFKGSIANMSFFHFIGNKILSLITSILFCYHISDMETCYKMFTRKVANELELKTNGFEIEGEITGEILKKKYLIKEVPISYTARKKDGKKITWIDGIKTLIVLLRCRFGK